MSSDLVGILSSLVVIAGAVFALMSLSYRVEPTVSGVLATADGATLLIVTVKVRNAGLFPVGINYDKSGIRIWKVDNNAHRSKVQGSPRSVFKGETPPEVKK